MYKLIHLSLNMALDSLKFKHPFTCIVAGSTSSGKTNWVYNLLENWDYLIQISTNNLKVLWCYGQKESLLNKTPENIKINYFEGIPSEFDLKSFSPDIIVLDDLMNELKSDINVKNLFTKLSHHLNISVIFITQNIFSQDKSMRTISLNSHYICVMKSVRLTQQIGILANQIWPGKGKKITDIYIKATVNNFSYLLFDLHPQQIEDKFRIRNRIFRQELPKNLYDKYYSVPIYYSLE